MFPTYTDHKRERATLQTRLLAWSPYHGNIAIRLDDLSFWTFVIGVATRDEATCRMAVTPDPIKSKARCERLWNLALDLTFNPNVIPEEDR